jgi:hypothetical protein
VNVTRTPSLLNCAAALMVSGTGEPFVGLGDGHRTGDLLHASPLSADDVELVDVWILTPPGKLTDGHRAALAQITARCEELAVTRGLVREFAEMLCHRHGEHLEAWAAQAETSPVSELRGFAKGLRKDWAAVTAGLTVPYSSSPVEGHFNRIKMIKRQMYGRANPDLLRKRVLLAD